MHAQKQTDSPALLIVRTCIVLPPMQTVFIDRKKALVAAARTTAAAAFHSRFPLVVTYTHTCGGERERSIFALDLCDRYSVTDTLCVCEREKVDREEFARVRARGRWMAREGEKVCTSGSGGLFGIVAD